MSRFRFAPRPQGKVVVTHGGRRVAVETRYGVNLERVRDRITTGPANLMLMGDSISSHQALPRLPTGIALSWPVPNGIAGWYVHSTQAATGPLVNFGNTVGEGQGGWPFAGFDHVAGANCTRTTYAVPDSTTEILTGVVNPMAKPCKKYAFSGVPNYQSFMTVYLGPQGQCQTGSVWASGDWITQSGSSTLRIGVVHLANSATCTANMRLTTQEGMNSTGGAGSSTGDNFTPSTPVTPAVEVVWVNKALSHVDTPFGTTNNSPGLTANPLFMQYEGVGSWSPGNRIISNAVWTANPSWQADSYSAGDYSYPAGNAQWVGAFRINPNYNDNTADQNGKNFIIYGLIVEDTANTTGLYVDSISQSGYTLTSHVAATTAAQIGKAFNTNSSRPTNWVMLHIGENATTAEWDSGNIDEDQIRTDTLALIAHVNAAWDAEGLPRGEITLVAPWETVGGTKSGSAWYTTVAGIYRELARGSTQISFIDLRQMFADRFSADELYNASRNSHMNILADGVHPSLRGTRVYARSLWQAIMGSIDE